MGRSIWEGARVTLRAVELSDWEVFHRNDADTDTARAGWFVPLPRSAADTRKWVEEQAADTGSGDDFRFAIDNLDGGLVGSLNTHACNPRHGTFEYGITIFRLHRQQGYASDAIRVMLGYYFRELAYQKVTVTVYAFNEHSLRLHKRLGFRVEGRLRRMVRTDGQHHDEIVMGLTAEEFEELTRPEHHGQLEA